MKLSELQQQFAEDTVQLFMFIHQQGCGFTYGEAMRSAEQAAIYAKDGKGIADSLHCKRLAIDINIFNKNGKYMSDTKDYAIFGEFWESLHSDNRWGGRFHRADGNHFERKDTSKA